MSRTLVALHAHPDDEASKGAATVSRYVDEGVRAVLVTATGGEAGEILNPAMDREEVKSDLKAVREAELMASAGVIGFHRVELLGYRDSGMPDMPDNANPEAFVNASFEEALEKVVRIIREERPQVLLGYDDHVRYPHPDHLRIRDLGIAAFEAAADGNRFVDSGDPWQVSRLYAPVFTVARLYALHNAVLDSGLESPFIEWLERLDDDSQEREAERTLMRVKVAGTLERGREALRAHRTQVDPEGFWFQVPLSVVLEAYPYEDFELLASVAPVAAHHEDLFD
ncbi:MAG: mycothiol conjugate amidase Mca [Acidimicrobiia bacterium]|nr:mycothiol conjugate amidase Mca [Acidimicrobiia bacterium]NNF62974.1 mycothiol conjugate amidase Mca [Acidimicrobiia bacterium]